MTILRSVIVGGPITASHVVAAPPASADPPPADGPSAGTLAVQLAWPALTATCRVRVAGQLAAPLTEGAA